MAPFYRGFTTDVKLASDDIEAIQELYGEKTKECVRSTAQSLIPAYPAARLEIDLRIY